MTIPPESAAANQAMWDERAPAHAASSDYAFAQFAADPAHLSHVVRFDVAWLGDLARVRAVHLQCHIGTDTVSLARLGAQMTGLDFSGVSIKQARALADAAGAEVDFVQSDVYAALDVLPAESFDLVFTGIGALCWLPDIRGWARVVRGLLRPGGRLFIREGHPVLWAIDERDTERIVVGYPYFETPEPLVFDEPGTYVDTEHEFVNTVSHSWNHGLGEIISALLAEGLTITQFVEHDSVPWNALPGQMELDPADGEWRLSTGRNRLPLTYTLQAERR